MSTAAGSGWDEELRRLEAHADRAEQVMRGLVPSPGDPGSPDSPDGELSATWEAPVGLGPMPEEFLPRARILLERQQRLMAAIPAAIASNRHQRRVAVRVSDATATPGGPVYLDVTA